MAKREGRAIPAQLPRLLERLLPLAELDAVALFLGVCVGSRHLHEPARRHELQGGITKMRQWRSVCWERAWEKACGKPVREGSIHVSSAISRAPRLGPRKKIAFRFPAPAARWVLAARTPLFGSVLDRWRVRCGPRTGNERACRTASGSRASPTLVSQVSPPPVHFS